LSELAKKVTALTSLVAVIFGCFFFLDARHAPTTELKALAERVTLQELRRLLREAEDDMFHYRRLARKYPNDKDIEYQLTIAEERVADLKARIKAREA
jgi:hypothetical protein